MNRTVDECVVIGGAVLDGLDSNHSHNFWIGLKSSGRGWRKDQEFGYQRGAALAAGMIESGCPDLLYHVVLEMVRVRCPINIVIGFCTAIGEAVVGMPIGQNTAWKNLGAE